MRIEIVLNSIPSYGQHDSVTLVGAAKAGENRRIVLEGRVRFG